MDVQRIGAASVRTVEMEGGSAESDSALASRRASELHNLGVWAAAVGYLVVTVCVAWGANLWRDEMYSLHTTGQSPAFAVRQAIGFELQPPLYFALLSVWRTIDSSPFFARFFSTLCASGAILTVPFIVRRIAPRIDPAWAAAVFASHPFLVWAGSEIRVYGLTVLVSAFLMLAFLNAYGERVGSVRSRLLYAALAVACVYTQYYLAVLFVCFGAALIVRRDRRALVAYAIDMVGVALLSAPFLLLARAQLAYHRDDFGPRLSLGVGAIRAMVTRFETYVFSFNMAIDESRWTLGTVRLARWAYRATWLGAVGFALYRWRPRFGEKNLRAAWPLVAILASYAVCMLGLFFWAGPLSVGERHTAGLLTPALVAAVAVPALAIGQVAARSWAAFLVVSNVAATLLTQVIPMAKSCDCRRVAETIASREKTQEPILVFPSEDAMPLAAYYGGHNRLLPIPRPPRLDHWDTSRFVLRDPREIAQALSEGSPDHQGLWVHTNIMYGQAWGREKLEAFLAEGYQEDGRREFAHGVILRHFMRKPPKLPRLNEPPSPTNEPLTTPD